MPENEIEEEFDENEDESFEYSMNESVQFDENGEPIMPAFLGSGLSKRELAKQSMVTPATVKQNTESTPSPIVSETPSEPLLTVHPIFGAMKSMEQSFNLSISVNMVSKDVIKTMCVDGGLDRNEVFTYIKKMMSSQTDAIAEQLIKEILGE